jgi:hypothetical protein
MDRTILKLHTQKINRQRLTPTAFVDSAVAVKQIDERDSDEFAILNFILEIALMKVR